MEYKLENSDSKLLFTMYLSQIMKPSGKVWERMISTEALPVGVGVVIPESVACKSTVDLGVIPDILNVTRSVCYLTNGHFAEYLAREALANSAVSLEVVNALYTEAYQKHTKSSEISAGNYRKPRPEDLRIRIQKLRGEFLRIVEAFPALVRALEEIRGSHSVHTQQKVGPGYVDFYMTKEGEPPQLLEIKATTSKAYAEYNHHQLFGYAAYTDANVAFLLNMMTAELWRYDFSSWTPERRGVFKREINKIITR